MKTLVRDKRDMVGGSLPAFMIAYAQKQAAILPREKRYYASWEWQQGVGLLGIWGLFKRTNDKKYLDALRSYFDACITDGLPGKNVNTMAPILPLSFLAEYTNSDKYMKICEEWAKWAMEEMPRTEEGGMQHRTTDDENVGELWDDTLMMTVLPVANIGRILGKPEYIDEATYQFLLHGEYLADPGTGLWYHGFSFVRKDHFAGAFWGRGNCWATITILLFLEIAKPRGAVRRYLCSLLRRQADALLPLQDGSGMWHTLLDKPDSYLEASATAGFGYGFLKGMKMGVLDERFEKPASLALNAILSRIDGNGVLGDVSGGTPMGRDTQDFYRSIPIQPMPYGQALAALFFCQVDA
jgi:unsaturated rhamnogalacturonyl hydrolase